MATSIFISIYLTILTVSTLMSSSSSALEEQAGVLLTFKSSLDDQMGSLSTWSNTTLVHPCKWVGVTCNTSSVITSLSLQSFNLSGEISPSVCKLQALFHLNLANNFFNLPFPLQLSKCTLQSLNLSSNLIWGTIPDEVSLFGSLKMLDLSRNHVEGRIPDTLGSLKGLQVLNLGSNFFSGNVSSSNMFRNLGDLVVLDLSDNPFLLSEIPIEIGKLEKLEQILFQRSGFHGLIPESFKGLHGLEILDLSGNNLTGGIGLAFGLGLENLRFFDVSSNRLSGSFPTGVCNKRGLTQLSLHTNFFTGSIPESFKECLNLERFQVQNNGFLGNFPNGLWSLPRIRLIRAENNWFDGEIPNSISMATSLEHVQMDNNSLAGRVPTGLGLLSGMYRFSVSSNRLYGDLPPNFCDSPVMSILNLSHNSLSGKIPELTKCRKLVSLSLAGNNFVGEIPNSFAKLPVLTYLDLSNNNLTGSIPQDLQNLKLALFNVSFNRLSGKVPLSLITGLPASFLQGNPDLCGSGLPNSCSYEKSKRFSGRPAKLTWILIWVALASGVMLVAVGFFLMYRSSKKKLHSGSWTSVFFYPLRISERDLMAGMDEKSAVNGGGTFGKVYIVRLPSGEFVAVKKLMNSGSLSFKALKSEIKTLVKIRHRNIIKLLGFCYWEDSILLIYEFMQNWSLGDMIYKLDFQLEWSIRLQIAIGAAQGLAYLHKDYVPRLLHRNFKSRNILLDKNFEPKLTDFALDLITGEAVFQSMIGSESVSCCYVAPEQGCSKKATEEMDIYSFGVVLLELVTGRHAEKAEIDDSLDVVKWVRRKINTTNGAIQVLDPKISISFQERMLGALDIALRCTSVLPEKRPKMIDVVRLLQSLDSKK
ncbi:hypothetical protein GIB67_040170 [Kingdonia uniflora]|uniref:Protein kinase domain-containing protein n=1 Tax=Kingdonia uniflora TaxID=39325 RepID=A0A7J7MUV2_9MAGN|nr:hypothetical protein GIB67_040170 [Kingdonia uniflora]